MTRLRLENCALQPSSRGQFSSLQILTLEEVCLTNGEFPCILSSCLNLERLEVLYCELPSKLCICGRSLQLRYLYFEFCPGVKEMDISAGNLSVFLCYTKDMINYSLHYVPKLEELTLNCNGSGTIPCVFGEAAKYCTGINQLFLQTKTDKVCTGGILIVILLPDCLFSMLISVFLFPVASARIHACQNEYVQQP